jgi:hypothetical protein
MVQIGPTLSKCHIAEKEIVFCQLRAVFVGVVLFAIGINFILLWTKSRCKIVSYDQFNLYLKSG